MGLQEMQIELNKTVNVLKQMEQTQARLENSETENKKLKDLVDRSLTGISWIRQQALELRIQNSRLNNYIHQLNSIHSAMKREISIKEIDIRIARRESGTIYELVDAKDEEIYTQETEINRLKEEHKSG